MIFVGKWLELEGILMTEVAQLPDDKFCIFYSLSNSRFEVLNFSTEFKVTSLGVQEE